MKQGWEIKKLGDIVDFKRGLTYSKKDEVDYSSNIVLRANNVNLITNRLDFEELKYINDNVIVPEEKKVKKGSLLICTASGSKSHLGKVALIDDEYGYSFGGFMGQITPHPNIESKFLFYALISDFYKEFIGNLSDGVNINNLKYDDLKQFSFRVPSLQEQQGIVSILDEAFASIARAKANAEQNLKNVRELFENYLESIFENKDHVCEEKRLVEVCEIRPPKSEARNKLKRTDLVSFVPMEDLGISQKIFIPAKERRLNDVEGSYTYFADEDVLLAKITPCFENGKLGIARDLTNGIGFGSSEFIVFRVSGNLYSEFLYYYLLRERFRIKGAERMLGAVGHKRVSKEYIDNSLIPLPSITTQKSIVQKLDALSAETKKLETIYQQKLNDLEELKKSILQKAFKGEL